MLSEMDTRALLESRRRFGFPSDVRLAVEEYMGANLLGRGL